MYFYQVSFVCPHFHLTFLWDTSSVPKKICHCFGVHIVLVCDGLLWIQVEVAEKNAEENDAALLHEEQEKNQKAERRRAKNKKV